MARFGKTLNDCALSEKSCNADSIFAARNSFARKRGHVCMPMRVLVAACVLCEVCAVVRGRGSCSEVTLVADNCVAAAEDTR